MPFRLLIHERGAISLFGVYMGVTKSPGGLLGISRDFLGFEIFDSGIFLGTKIWQVFFGVA